MLTSSFKHGNLSRTLVGPFSYPQIYLWTKVKAVNLRGMYVRF